MEETEKVTINIGNINEGAAIDAFDLAKSRYWSLAAATKQPGGGFPDQYPVSHLDGVCRVIV